MSCPCSRLIRLSCATATHSQAQATWDEIASIMDLSLSIQHFTVQATAKTIVNDVLQECAHWLNLTSLSDRDAGHPIIPEGIFGSALPTMQERVEAKSKKDEALKCCLYGLWTEVLLRLDKTTCLRQSIWKTRMETLTGLKNQNSSILWSLSNHLNYKLNINQVPRIFFVCNVLSIFIK